MGRPLVAFQSSSCLLQRVITWSPSLGFCLPKTTGLCILSFPGSRIRSLTPLHHLLHLSQEAPSGLAQNRKEEAKEVFSLWSSWV